MISALHNSSALTARLQLGRNQKVLETSLHRLATGKRINSGKDDPAALISSEQLAAEIRALEAASRSLDRADSRATVTDGQVGQVSSMLGELRGLVVASANTGGLTEGELEANQLQIDGLVSSIERISGDAITSLDGYSLPDSGNAEVEAQLSAAMQSARSLQTGGANSLGSGEFEAAMASLDSALLNVNTARGTIGSFQKNTIQTQLSSNGVALANLNDSRSRLADTDFAIETSRLARAQTLVVAGMKVLHTAQQQTGLILDLLA